MPDTNTAEHGAVLLTEEQLARLEEAVRGGLPDAIVRWEIDEHSTEYHLFVETWTPTEPDAAGRFRDQLRVALEAEIRATLPDKDRLIAALVVSLGEAETHLATRAELLRGASDLLEITGTYFDRVIELAAASEDPALKALSAELVKAFRADEDGEGRDHGR